MRALVYRMIDELLLSVSLVGDNFSPKEAETITGLSLRKKLEVGEISPIGRYRGKPIPYGSASLEVPDEIPYGERLMWIVNVLQENLNQLYDCGAEETHISAGYLYKDQCNFEFSKEELAALAKLNIDFAISCYDVSDEENE